MVERQTPVFQDRSEFMRKQEFELGTSETLSLNDRFLLFPSLNDQQKVLNLKCRKQ